jgi:hypothetical protein
VEWATVDFDDFDAEPKITHTTDGIQSHGTAMASLIAGKTIGVAPESKIIAVKAFEDGTHKLSAIILKRCLTWAFRDIIVRGRLQQAVVNVSLTSSPKLKMCCRYIDEMVAAHGFIVVECFQTQTSTFGHRRKKIRHPVRSALVKLPIARLVLQWVTMRESLVLNVLLRDYPFFCQREGASCEGLFWCSLDSQFPIALIVGQHLEMADFFHAANLQSNVQCF